MKNKFEPIPFSKSLLAWSKSASTSQALGAAVRKADVGSSSANPAPLAPEMEGSPAAARCEWALGQLAGARQALAAAREAQARAAAWHGRLEKLRGEKKAEESARARKRALKLLAVAAVLVVIVGGAGAIWWSHRPP